MRQLALMGAITSLALFGALLPLPVLADVTQSDFTTLTTDSQRANGGWTQYLGNGNSGALTQADFHVQFNRSIYYGPVFLMGLDACDDADYTQCHFTTTSGGGTLNPPGAGGVDTDTILTFDTSSGGGIVLDPNKYYRLYLGISFANGGGAFRPYGSSGDAYPGGATDATGLGDLAFQLVGISYTGTTTPLPPPTGVVIDHTQGGSIITAPNYVGGGIPGGIAIPHALLNSIPAGDYYAVVFFEGLVGCPSSNYEMNAFIPGAYWGYDGLPDGFAKANSTSGGGCMQHFHIDPNKGDPWQWGALSNTGMANAIGDSNNIPAFAICYDAASCDTLAPTSTPPGPTASNVLFLPGTLTSQLYQKTGVGVDVPLWGPTFNNLIPQLALDANGNSKSTIYVGNIIDSMFGGAVPVYGSFMSYMDSITQGTATSSPVVIQKWQAYPYDWRFDVLDIVTNGTLKKDGSRDYVDQDVLQLASTSPTGKVTIIAHSNGGLLAKALMIKLAQEGRANLIDKIILVGTPQFGTPKTIGQMLHGDELTNALGIVTYAGTMRDAAATMPGMYGLIPSPAYFSHVATPVASFKTTASTDPYGTEFGVDGINSYQEMIDFLTDKLSIHSTLPVNDLRIPLKLSSSLLNKEKATHATLDAWVPPASTTVISISGWGQPSPSDYLYTTTNGQFHCDSTGGIGFTCGFDLSYSHIASTTQDGDDTVVTPSAEGDTQSNLYFNAKSFGDDTQIRVVHQTLLSATPIQTQVTKIIQGDHSQVSYVGIIKPVGGNNALVSISAHSPVNIVATDASGNQTGFVSIPGTSDFYQILQNIPGSYAEQYDDEKYLYVPQGVAYTIKAIGYGTGTTTLESGPVNSDGSIALNQRFANIPTRATTVATFSVDTAGVASNPKIDIDGNGTVDFIASSSATSTQQTSSQLIAFLKQKINALSISPLLKTLLLLALQDIDNRKNSILSAKPFILVLEKLIWTQTDAKIIQQRTQLLEILNKI